MSFSVRPTFSAQVAAAAVLETALQATAGPLKARRTALTLAHKTLHAAEELLGALQRVPAELSASHLRGGDYIPCPDASVRWVPTGAGGEA